MALYLSAVFTKETQYADEEPLFAGWGFNVCEAAFEYHPRHSEERVLYHVVAARFWVLNLHNQLLSEVPMMSIGMDRQLVLPILVHPGNFSDRDVQEEYQFRAHHPESPVPFRFAVCPRKLPVLHHE